MRKGIVALLMIAAGLGNPLKASGQANEIAQLILNVEKLAQLKQILSDMKKGYTIVKGGYNTIKDISEGNFSLHKNFLDELMQVNPAVRNYYKVARIVDYQFKLVQEYKAAYNRFKQSGSFSPDEIAYLGKVYERLLKESIRNLDELVMVITSGDLRMSDNERLEAIDRIYADMEEKLQFLRYFNDRTSMLGIQRQRDQQSNERMQKMYGLDKNK